MKHWRRRSSAVLTIVLQVLILLLPDPGVAMTMDQFLTSLDMIRNGCAPKFKLKTEDLDRLRVGDFSFPPSQDLMCYTKCVSLMAGTVNKKGEFNAAKALAQLPHLVPPELMEMSRKSVEACRDTYKQFKESCERVFQTAKCFSENSDDRFMWP
ncbi:general odorant-binding protein lush isoform X2 [Drosophila yakuba]|uniref:Odorant-binding protein 76a-1 n=1 Tax=Drosophila yakuba TaxID=7245 RepID=B4IVV6_DROYA|nr:general odorant-binding protein lush isoform X2 [Drosophila yakuba]EDW95305.1 Odorant-binding protein 76a-1 [Drosophila yakuba]EDX00399.1 Odorant-binding protein 76a-2 [Drosophila yakuba]